MIKALWNSLCGTSQCELEGQLMSAKKKVHDLERQALAFVNEIQELKAINHYQTFDLERKVNDLAAQLDIHKFDMNVLEQENRLLKDKIEARKRRRAERLKAKREQKETNG